MFQNSLSKTSFKTLVVLSCLISLPALADDFPWQPQPKPIPSPGIDNRPTKEQPLLAPTTPAIPECEVSLVDPAYRNLVQRMAHLDMNPTVAETLKSVGLNISKVSWQDTGRSHQSSGGSNISDVRLLALSKHPQTGKNETTVQPIIRLPNFGDITVDVNLDEVFVPVGNAWGVKPFAVSLKTLLESPSDFMSWRERPKGSLLADRDSQVLVSAQASIMPVPKDGKAHFVPSIYNYQTNPESPAVLVILVTNRGTSITVVDNNRDKAEGLMGSWGAGGQMLFHNKNGEKAPLVLESLKSVMQTSEGQARVGDLQSSGQSVAGQSAVNQVLMIQVPLRQPRVVRMGAPSYTMPAGAFGGVPESIGIRRSGYRGLDTGVVDVASFTLGKFIELNDQGSILERDLNLPIRVDVQYYMASDTTQLTVDEVKMLPEQLRGIYTAGKNLGSLVTGDNYDRITRNYQPWTRPWWNTIVWPYIPVSVRPNPLEWFVQQYGSHWIYRFANEEMARYTVSSMSKQAE